LLTPTSTELINAIKSRNLPHWHIIQFELQLFNLAMVVPNLVSISPASGPNVGGQPVTIVGTDFVLGMTVEIGGSAATNIVIHNSTTATAVTPSNITAGPVNVLIQARAGSNVLLHGYFYVDVPVITSVSPWSGPKAGGQSLTIVGSHFVLGMTVKIGGNAATNVTVIDSATLTADAPSSLTTGPVNVLVETIGGSSTLLQGYTYQ
jgi:hypothetical protein